VGLMGLLITFVIVLAVTLIYLKSVDDMMTNHSDYKGEDLFGDD
jgi:uncharacterized membrane protein